MTGPHFAHIHFMPISDCLSHICRFFLITLRIILSDGECNVTNRSRRPGFVRLQRCNGILRGSRLQISVKHVTF